MLKALTHVPGKLKQRLIESDTTVFLDAQSEAYIYSVLAPGDHTFVRIESPTAHEVVRLTAQCGTLILQRGLDNSRAQRFPIGACVHFVPTFAYIHSYVCEGE